VFLQQGIAVRGANAHIHNGSIVDINCPFWGSPDCAAIRLFEAPGTRINGMSLHNNTVGIITFSDANANGARIHGNDITGNLRIGIGLFGMADGAKVTDNDLSDTGGFAFGGQGYFGSSDDVSLIGNVANNNARAGILLWGSADFPPAERNTVRDNTTLDNEIGIILAGSAGTDRPRDNLIQSNTSFGNANDDLREGTGGAGPTTDCLNTWKDNDFEFAAPDCIE
jgi:parallel beta-helix repeat protein